MLGVGLIALPHIYGAPQPAEYRSLVPEGLAHSFVAAAVVTSFLFQAHPVDVVYAGPIFWEATHAMAVMRAPRLPADRA